ncbi:tail tape measure protein (plasmid) [Borrelia miyamotoi]|uniref:Tail tape measure protein n=4 Tax=Pseudomonadati TaxID=3379134 RepID=A0A482CX92_9SPIR|nr:tail tape measure protein [Borrelia miyamotoi]AHH05797.1 Putative membrane spanning protein [Borrelia miyamotoi FR64b]QBK62562.1 tail tape measure protein [Borrelia miyamotoi]QBK66294.1 tail tape measure protein [Borrelia miyamotoi]QBL99195.1 tail tape measure protein [Borrelia miyamotoi]QDA32713.1 tail tape measure protein [Borrelia miyamotoi]
MTLDEIVIPLSINATNESKLDEISDALKKIANQEFENLKDLQSKLENAIKTGSGVNTVYNALIANTEKMKKNFKNLANSIKGVGDKSGNVKTLRNTLKSVSKSLFDVKTFANKASQALEQLINSALPITIVIKAIEKIGSTIAGVFTGALDSVSSFNEEIGVFTDMLGNAEVGEVLASDMRAFGEETLFTSKAIHNAAKTMLSYGATAFEVSQRMRMFGEVAGSNSAGLEKLAEVYSKVEAGNQVTLEDLRELRSVGIDITDILEKEAEEAGSSLFKMTNDGKLGFDQLSSAIKKATGEGGKFYRNTSRGAKTLSEVQLQTSKMSQQLFLELGQAFEPIMISFEKVKQVLLVGIVAPITKLTSATIFLFNKLVELVKYVTTKFVRGFKVAFDPIIKMFEKVTSLVSTLWSKMTDMFSSDKGEDKNTDDLLKEDKKKPDLAMELNKNIVADYKGLQEEIFKMQRDVALKPLKEQEKATRRLQSIINAKNKAFISKYGKSFNALTVENRKTLASVEKEVNDFAKTNHGFINEHKDLQSEIAKLNREILTLPYEKQEEAMKELANTINVRQKEFVDKYYKSFDSLNDSNKSLLTSLQKGVNEFSKTATDRAFVDAHKSLQEKVTSMQFEVMMLPLKEREQATIDMQAKINNLYNDFVNSHKEEFDRLNESNKNILLQIVNQSEQVIEKLADNVGDSVSALFDVLLNSVSGVVNKVANEDLGKDLATGGVSKAADTLTGSLFDASKDILSSLGPWGSMASAALSFTVGIFKGMEQQRIKEIEDRRDRDLEELAKKSEVELMRIEEGFDREIAMRKEKLSELDNQYNKEIEFLKQAQSKGQISGEEFQKRIEKLESEYKEKKQQESERITRAEDLKKLEGERARKLEVLEGDRIKAKAEVDKVNASNLYWGKSSDLAQAQKILNEILQRISKVKSARSLEEIKLARKGAMFKTTRPTFMPGAGLMTSEMGQSELIRVTPAPIEENLRRIEAKIIAEEINKIQQSEGVNKGQVIINNYNFHGDVLDADKLVRMLKAKEHAMGFRMAE